MIISYVIYDTTPSECNCTFRLTMGLPCMHIFALREYLNMVLFCPKLCLERWSRAYDAENMRSLGDVDHGAACETPSFKLPQESTSISITPRRNTASISARRRILSSLVNEIVDVGSLSVGKSFEEKRETLEQLISC